jgi:hypothetical protein
MSLSEYFKGDPTALRLFEAVRETVDSIGRVDIRATKSQVSFRRKKAFAWIWIPGKYLKGRKELAPLVLTIGLRRRDHSPRWKEIVEPYPGRFTHHLELHSINDIDDEVRGWIREAWEAAG